MSTAIGGASNPDRIAANIVTGIGFLGAGVIFRGENRVNGITTAATIWAVAAVGMGIGGGYYFAAACASILILFILAILPYLQNRIDSLNQSRTLTIRSQLNSNARLLCESAMTAHRVKGKLVRQVKDGTTINLTWHLQGRAQLLEQFLDDMLAAPFVEHLDC